MAIALISILLFGSGYCETSHPDTNRIADERILRFLVPPGRKDLHLLPWIHVSIGPREKEIARRLIQPKEADAIILGRVFNTATGLDSYVYGTEIYVEVERVLRDTGIGFDTTQVKTVTVYETNNRRVYDPFIEGDLRKITSGHPEFVHGDRIIAGLSRYPSMAIRELLQKGGVPPDIFREWFYKEALADGFEFGGLGVWKINADGEAVKQMSGFHARIAMPAADLIASIVGE